ARARSADPDASQPWVDGARHRSARIRPRAGAPGKGREHREARRLRRGGRRGPGGRTRHGGRALARRGRRAPPRAAEAEPRCWRRLGRAGCAQHARWIDRRIDELTKVPTLVLWGNEDRVISVADAKRCRDLPLAEVCIAPGVGHSLPLEAAAWANAHITRFVTALRQERAKAA